MALPLSRRLARDRLADLERHFEILLEDPRSRHGRSSARPRRPWSRDQAQHLGRLRAHVLGTGVAGELHGDAAFDRLKPGRQTLLAWRCRRHIR